MASAYSDDPVGDDLDPVGAVDAGDPVAAGATMAFDEGEIDLDVPADPYGVPTDPGDFGLADVDAPAPAVPAPVATAGLSEDAYMDQPDVGSTSSYGDSDSYADAYGDSGEDTSVEYTA
jgi:hypothetical protein